MSLEPASAGVDDTPSLAGDLRAEVGTTEWEDQKHPWSPECDLVLSRHPVPAVHVIVHDDEHVLLLDEPIPQQPGVLSLPSGFTKYDEGPRESALRELHEGTGLHADPADLEFLTIYHTEFPNSALYFITYALARADTSGELTPEAEGFETEFRPIEAVLEPSDRIRESDRERIRMAVG